MNWIFAGPKWVLQFANHISSTGHCSCWSFSYDHGILIGLGISCDVAHSSYDVKYDNNCPICSLQERLTIWYSRLIHLSVRSFFIVPQCTPSSVTVSKYYLIIIVEDVKSLPVESVHNCLTTSTHLIT